MLAIELFDPIQPFLEELRSDPTLKTGSITVCAYKKTSLDRNAIQSSSTLLSRNCLHCCLTAAMLVKAVALVVVLAVVVKADPIPQPDPNPGYFNKYGTYVQTVEDYASPFSPYFNAPYAAAYGSFNPYIDYAYPTPYVVARSYY
uniref:Uncharacterized protein n=1 Tax=Cacopsylla melanoneura TaxID=428564 RepID=A0A8D8WVK6_9HEMI